MRRGAGIRIIGALLAVGAVATLMAIAYGAGFSDGSVADTRTVPPLVFGGAFVGWHIIGLIVSLFILAVVFRLMALAFFGHRHGHWDRAASGELGPRGPHGSGPWHRGWHHGEWRSAGQAFLDDWHRQAHETAATDRPTSAGGDAPTGPAAS